MKRVLLSPDGLDISKPGYDVLTATDEQKHMSSTRRPALVIQSGRVTVTTGSPVSVPWAYTLSEPPMVEVQIGNSSTLTLLPWWNRTGDQLRIQISVSTTEMILTATGSNMYVNYIAVAKPLG